jgi:hypothetical protein
VRLIPAWHVRATVVSVGVSWGPYVDVERGRCLGTVPTSPKIYMLRRAGPQYHSPYLLLVPIVATRLIRWDMGDNDIRPCQILVRLSLYLLLYVHLLP